jgi:hypothetical protein
MKRLVLGILFLLTAVAVFAQGTLYSGRLQAISLTTAQRLALAPVNAGATLDGYLVYDTTQGLLYCHTNGVWAAVNGGGGGGTNGNDGSSLTNLNASQLTHGTVPYAVLPSGVLTNDESLPVDLYGSNIGGRGALNLMSPGSDFYAIGSNGAVFLGAPTESDGTTRPTLFSLYSSNTMQIGDCFIDGTNVGSGFLVNSLVLFGKLTTALGNFQVDSNFLTVGSISFGSDAVVDSVLFSGFYYDQYCSYYANSIFQFGGLPGGGALSSIVDLRATNTTIEGNLAAKTSTAFVEFPEYYLGLNGIDSLSLSQGYSGGNNYINISATSPTNIIQIGGIGGGALNQAINLMATNVNASGNMQFLTAGSFLDVPILYLGTPGNNYLNASFGTSGGNGYIGLNAIDPTNIILLGGLSGGGVASKEIVLQATNVAATGIISGNGSGLTNGLPSVLTGCTGSSGVAIGSATTYLAGNGTISSTAETACETPVPRGGYLTNWCMTFFAANILAGSNVVCTLDTNGVSTGITMTLSGGGANPYYVTNTTGGVYIAPFTKVSVKMVPTGTIPAEVITSTLEVQ